MPHASPPPERPHTATGSRNPVLSRDSCHGLLGGLFGDRRFPARVQREAAGLVRRERARSEARLRRIEAETRKVVKNLDRYFAAFEDCSLSPEMCAARIDELQSEKARLSGEGRELEDRVRALVLPPLDYGKLSKCIGLLKRVIAGGGNCRKRFLLGFFVKDLLMKGATAAEIEYALPEADRFIGWANPGRRGAPPEAYPGVIAVFRVRFEASAGPAVGGSSRSAFGARSGSRASAPRGS